MQLLSIILIEIAWPYCVRDPAPATPGNSSTDFLIPPDPTVFMPAYADLLQWGERHPQTGCLLTSVSLDTEIAAPPYHEAGSAVHKTPAVGFADQMLSGDCPDAAVGFTSKRTVATTSHAPPMAKPKTRCHCY